MKTKSVPVDDKRNRAERDVLDTARAWAAEIERVVARVWALIAKEAETMPAEVALQFFDLLNERTAEEYNTLSTARAERDAKGGGG